jgi:hypothetical protein
MSSPLLTIAMQKKVGFDFMVPLVEDMVRLNPAARATMPEVVTRFHALSASLDESKLRSRVINQADSYFFGFFRSLAHWSRRIMYTIRHVPPIPQPSPRPT